MDITRIQRIDMAASVLRSKNILAKIFWRGMPPFHKDIHRVMSIIRSCLTSMVDLHWERDGDIEHKICHHPQGRINNFEIYRG